MMSMSFRCPYLAFLAETNVWMANLRLSRTSLAIGSARSARPTRIVSVLVESESMGRWARLAAEKVTKAITGRT